MELKYAITVQESELDGEPVWLAWTPDVPGVGAIGKSREEALQKVDVALHTVLEAIRARGELPPMPGGGGAFGMGPGPPGLRKPTGSPPWGR